MSPVKALLAGVLMVLALAACGTISKPVAGRGRPDDPLSASGHLQCLRRHGLPATRLGTTAIRVGSAPGSPTIQFAPTPGAAEAEQLENREQGAEVIGSALLYPNLAPDAELNVIENCLDRGVQG